MSGPLDGCRAKAERAKQHLGDLEVTIKRFFESNPYEVRAEDNPQTGKREHRVVRCAEPPHDLPLITGDVVHNLRAALDQIVWQLILANGGNPQEYRSAFPIWKSEAAYKSGRPGDAKGISKHALKVLYALKPYKGGNEALWGIHSLDIVDKHRLLLTVAAAHRSVIIDVGAQWREASVGAPEPWGKLSQSLPDMPIALNPEEHVALAPGVVLFGAPLGDKSHDKVKFEIEIALKEPQVIESEPLIGTLHEFVRTTDEIISLFEPLIS